MPKKKAQPPTPPDLPAVPSDSTKKAYYPAGNMVYYCRPGSKNPLMNPLYRFAPNFRQAMYGGQGQWIMALPALNSILFVTSWKSSSYVKVPDVNHIVDPGRRFWTEAEHQRRIYKAKNLVLTDAKRWCWLTLGVQIPRSSSNWNWFLASSLLRYLQSGLLKGHTQIQHWTWDSLVSKQRNYQRY